jgi:uncharacterized protein (TIGR03083 family)
MILRTGGACELDPDHLLQVFSDQLAQFLAVVRDFGPDDWAAPTRCARWSAHEVVRHMCDVIGLLTVEPDDRTLDVAAGFDPRIAPAQWLAGSADESPRATLSRFTAVTQRSFAVLGDRRERGSSFDVGLPFGAMDWTILAMHIFWDSWIHQRDIMLARGGEHPTTDDATHYAAAYGLFIAAAVAVMFGQAPSQQLTLGGPGGGTFDLDSDGGVTLTASRASTTGWPAAQVADALAGRAPGRDALTGPPPGPRAPLYALADYFTTPVP